MRCPHCYGIYAKVLETRTVPGGKRRRLLCWGCGRTFTQLPDGTTCAVAERGSTRAQVKAYHDRIELARATLREKGYLK